MVMIKNKINMLLAAVLLVLATVSCSEWDEFKEFTEGGEIIYPGKMDSVVIYPGKERVQFRALLNPDPNVVMYKIFWNDFKDSITFNIDKESGKLPVENTFSVSEGVKNFVVYTYDDRGNISVPVNSVGVSYGASYRRKLSNRLVSSLVFGDQGTTINWEQMDLTTGAQFTEITYEVNGVAKTIETPVTQSTTVLEGLVSTTTIQYRTIFKPEANSIDTFAVPPTDYFIRVVPQLKNNKVPFIAAAVSGRWGNLADWQSNDAVKNHGGYGGWDEWNGNIFNVESGWGSPAVTNGKIWQTLTLEPGTYTFRISDLRDTNLTDADQTYLVATLGSTLPDVENIASALASVKVYNRPVAEMRIDFTITETAEVSLGYLTTQPDGNPGKYCNIRAFDFYFNE
jgi:Domain of unknown function/Domain of unknown function (DUF5013)